MNMSHITSTLKASVWVLLLGMLFPSVGIAALPAVINYQGYLADNAGNPVNDAVVITFRLYTTESGASLVWEETQSLTLKQGIIDTTLGAITPLNLQDFDNPLFLGVQIGADSEMTPRRPLALTGYAIKADDAYTVGGVNAGALDQSVHVSDIANPHQVTADQVGALSTTAIDDHAAIADAHHTKTTSFADLTDTAADAQIPAGISRDSELAVHSGNTSNPHSVTAAQIGASSASDLSSHSANASAHHTKTTSFSDLTDAATDTQIPATIARDTEIMSTVIANDGAGTSLDADLLDGMDSAAFAGSAHNHDPAYVNATGDTMTGALSIPDLTVTTSVSIPGHNVLTSSIPSNTLLGLNAGNETMGGGNNTAVGGGALRFNTQGNNNSAVGNLALNSNTIGSGNTAMGFQALRFNTEGKTNTAMGTVALSSNTTGNSNTAVGSVALTSNTTGFGNTAIGADALASNDTGGYNIAIGYRSLFSNTTGLNNTAVGYGALRANTTANFNTAVGFAALYFNTTGHHNTAMGNDALYTNTTGVSNTAMGTDALYANTTGGNNVAIGDSALFGNSTGNSNTAMGFAALYSNTTSNNSTAIGYNALRYNSTGNDNTAMGSLSLYQNTTGSGNTAIGAYALRFNTTGLSNVALGSLTLFANTTGGNNVAIGTNSLNDNTTGNSNTSVGTLALGKNTTGMNNTAIGYSALSDNTTGSSNLAVGVRAGKTNNGIGNVFLGYEAGYNETGSNKLHIANNSGSTLIYGDFSTGQVGINTVSPNASLQVGSGTARINSSSRILVSNSAATNYIEVNNNSAGAAALFGMNNSSTANVATTGDLWLSPGMAATMTLLTNGNVGVGTSTPSSKLEVNGSAHVQGDLSASGAKSFIQPHAKDASKEIIYIAAEGPEAMVFVRGSAKLKNGMAVIETPEHFSTVAAKEGVEVQLTPYSADTYGLAVVERSRERIVVKEFKGGKGNFEFSYYITGVRDGFQEFQTVVENKHFKPAADETASDFAKRFAKDDLNIKAIRNILIKNGILKENGQVNMVMAKKLGWSFPETFVVSQQSPTDDTDVSVRLAVSQE